MDLHQDIDQVLISEDVIKLRISELAPQILEDFAGEPFVVVSLLKGALVFTADLFRQLPVRLDMECINVSSYHGGTESSGEVKFLDLHLPKVSGRKVLLVDDIFDTGLTMKAVRDVFLSQGASLVKSCVLLSKEKQREVDYDVDYTCFTIGDEFVVGYGLDYKGQYRNLPYVGVLKQEVIEG